MRNSIACDSRSNRFNVGSTGRSDCLDASLGNSAV